MKHTSTYNHQSQFIEMFGNSTQFVKKKVHDLFCLTIGKTPSRTNSSYWDQDGYEWASISDMGTWDKYTGKTAEHISKEAVSGTGIKVVPPNTIIMSFKLSIGRTCITTSDLYTNEAIMAFLPLSNDYNLDYLHFYIANYNWNNGAKQAVKGATLNKESIGNSFFILPTKELQEKFAAIVRQADKSKFDGFKSQFIEMFDRTKEKRLGDIATYVNGSAFKPEEWSSSGLPIVRIQNLTSPESTYNYFAGPLDRKVKITTGDILISWSATLDIYLWSQGDALLNQHIFKVIFDKEYVNKEFFIYSIKNVLGKMGDKAHGSTMKHIVKSDFDNILIRWPSEAEQEQFAAIVKQADKSKFELKKAIEAIDQVIKSLING